MEFFNSQFHVFCSSKLFIAQLVNLNPFLLKNKGCYSSTRAWQKIQICEWCFILQNYQNYFFQWFLHSKDGAFFMKCTFVVLWNFQNESFQAFLILSMDPFKAPLCGIAVLFMSMWCVISIWLVVPISFFLFSCYNLLWWHLLMLWFLQPYYQVISRFLFGWTWIASIEKFSILMKIYLISMGMYHICQSLTIPQQDTQAN